MELLAALCFSLDAPQNEAAPGVVLLVPAPNADGWIEGLDGRNWRMSDAKAVASRLSKPIPIDINHATEIKAPKGEEAPAAGWITALNATERGVEATVEWTPDGATKVQNREYRFISPVFRFHKATREIHHVTSAGLCNDPNFPLALNRQLPEDKPMTLLERLAKALNRKLATEDEAVTAVEQLTSDLETAQNSAQTPSLDTYVPRADYDGVLERATNAEQKLADQDAKALEATVDAELDKALEDRKITPATRDYHKARCMQEGGLEQFREFCKAAPAVASGPNTSGKSDGAAGVLTADQKAMCRSMGISEDDFLKELAAHKE